MREIPHPAAMSVIADSPKLPLAKAAGERSIQTIFPTAKEEAKKDIEVI